MEAGQVCAQESDAMVDRSPQPPKNALENSMFSCLSNDLYEHLMCAMVTSCYKTGTYDDLQVDHGPYHGQLVPLGGLRNVDAGILPYDELRFAHTNALHDRNFFENVCGHAGVAALDDLCDVDDDQPNALQTLPDWKMKENMLSDFYHVAWLMGFNFDSYSVARLNGAELKRFVGLVKREIVAERVLVRSLAWTQKNITGMRTVCRAWADEMRKYLF